MASIPASKPGEHLAAILPAKGSALEVVSRPDPTPGPDELVIEVKSMAVNPLDNVMREIGIFIASFPTVLGSDIAGTIVSTGSSVDPAVFPPGARVAAFAPVFFKDGNPDYGAFQTRALVHVGNVIPLPPHINFDEGSLLPMSVCTAWGAWNTIGIPLDTAYTPADKKGMLVWGAASSVGSAAVQIAKLLGFTVYATASERNHEYVKSLGAHRVFDYKNADVVSEIVKAAKDDGNTVATAFDAVGQLSSSMAVVKEFKGDGRAKVASAVLLGPDSPKMDGVELIFDAPPEGEEARQKFYSFVFNKWAKEKLETREYVPSPRVKVVGKGLEYVQQALDELKAGVSCVKLVVQV